MNSQVGHRYRLGQTLETNTNELETQSHTGETCEVNKSNTKFQNKTEHQLEQTLRALTWNTIYVWLCNIVKLNLIWFIFQNMFFSYTIVYNVFDQITVHNCTLWSLFHHICFASFQLSIVVAYTAPIWKDELRFFSCWFETFFPQAIFLVGIFPSS